MSDGSDSHDHEAVRGNEAVCGATASCSNTTTFKKGGKINGQHLKARHVPAPGQTHAAAVLRHVAHGVCAEDVQPENAV